MPDTYILGMNGKLYWGDENDLLADLTELTNVKDVTVTLEAGEADVTTRANSGWRATASTLRECSVEFEMVWQPGDAAFEAIRDAYLNGDLVELAVLDGDKDTAGSQGPKGSFSVTSFSRSEPLEEAMTASVSLKLVDYDQWVEVAS